MTSEQPASALEQHASLQQLIRESRHTEGPQIREFTRLASAVQRQRHKDGVSDTDRITRSTGLWTLMELDPDIRAALERGGVKQADLGGLLSIPTTVKPVRTDTADLHDDFVRAARAYLASRPRRSAVDLMDLAAAIVRAARDQAGGLLPERLKELSIDYELVLTAVDRFQGETRQQRVGADPPPLSETMQSVKAELSDPSKSRDRIERITAFEIVRAVVRRHPDYAGGRLDTASLETPSSAVGRSWIEWYNDVAQFYDRSVLARTWHKVLDGRLFLVGLGLIDSGLRDAVERVDAWVPLLLELDEAAAPSGSALWSVLQEIQFEYGYQSDQASGEDQLGVQDEVNAVCAVITDRKVNPPLAVGLFGEWGAGKSFFMERMRERVDQLTMPVDRRDGREGPRPFNVVQIRFNAWHYSDSSLWASLAIEIFERLVDPEPVGVDRRRQWLRDRGDAKRAERTDLLERLETYRDAKAELDAERDQLQAEREGIAKRREKASRQRRRTVERASLTDVAGELAKHPEVKEAIRRISTELGLNPAVEELKGLSAELRTTAGYLPTVWRMVRHKTYTVALTATFVVLALATAALITRSGWAWLGSLATAAGSVGAVVVTASKLIRPATQQVNKALAVVESAISTASEIEATLRSKRDREERTLDLRLAEIDHQIVEATQAIAALDEKIAATQASADALTVGRRLYDFLVDRAAGYQKHQGVVGMLHRDFRLLNAQLAAYDNGADPMPGWPAVDRVILYIDDLDRCPPAKVLEVLEAVHLLLALELFVVVVGVDPRWLQRSLRHQYRDLVTSGDPRTDPYLRDMPIEYLEKIFQIPLTLPAMEPLGYARLIASLAPAVSPSEPTEAQAAIPTTTRRASTNESPGGDRAPTRAVLSVEAGSAASGTRGHSIDLTQAELEFAQQLGALVDSPRAAKRLMNTYRLIRATRHVGSRSRFLGTGGQPGEYQAVLTLLAVAAGYPTMADRLLVALQDDATRLGIRQWSSFVDALNPAGEAGKPSQLVPPDLVVPSDGAKSEESATWANLYEALQACLAVNKLTDLEPYRRWGGVVARFSFTL